VRVAPCSRIIRARAWFCRSRSSSSPCPHGSPSGRASAWRRGSWVPGLGPPRGRILPARSRGQDVSLPVHARLRSAGLKTPRSEAPRTKAPRTSRDSRSRAVPSVGKENRLATGRSQLPLKPFHHRQSSLSPVAVRVATLPNPARLLTRIQEGHSSGDSPAHRPSVHLDRPTSAHPAFLLDEQVNSRRIFVHSPRCQRTLGNTKALVGSAGAARPMGARGRRGGRDRYRRHTYAPVRG